jgi:hypothetical protein
MRQRFRTSRPSPSLVISLVALFVSLGGAGWAAIHVPAGSVGTRQLTAGAVTADKIAHGAIHAGNVANGAIRTRSIAVGAIGAAQINPNQVQARVVGACSGQTGALGAITTTGTVTCTPTSPQEFGAEAPGLETGLSTVYTTVATKTLPSGSSYVVVASVGILVGGTAGSWSAAFCVLDDGRTVPPTSAPPPPLPAQYVHLTLPTGPDPQAFGTIPLQLTVPASSTATTVALKCARDGTAPAGSTATSFGPEVDAIRTASNS